MEGRKLIRSLGVIYPKRYREPGDFGGIMAGKIKKDIHSVMLCLDFDEIILPQALALNPDIIITHHPFIFGTKGYVLSHDPLKANLYQKVLEANLCIYSYHTNFDSAPNGMNDELASLLGLSNIKPLVSSPMARGGSLKEAMEIHKFASYAIKKLSVPYGLLIEEGKKSIKSVAIIGGGGWREAIEANKEGYDIFISGDAPHHGRRDIVLNHCNYLDLPHEIENAFMNRMEKTLLSLDPSLKVEKIYHELPPTVIR